jgi:hypothetical protein
MASPSDPNFQTQAFTRQATALTPTDPTRAEQIPRTITDLNSHTQALTTLTTALTPPTPPGPNTPPAPSPTRTPRRGPLSRWLCN